MSNKTVTKGEPTAPGVTPSEKIIDDERSPDMTG